MEFGNFGGQMGNILGKRVGRMGKRMEFGNFGLRMDNFVEKRVGRMEKKMEFGNGGRSITENFLGK